MEIRPKILHLPAWYPNRLDPQLGIFIRKHIESVSAHTFSELVYTRALPDVQQVEIEKHELEDFREVLVYYPKASGVLKKWFYRQKAFQTGLHQLKTNKPDLIHFHVLDRQAIVAARWANRLGIPYGITEHWTGYRSGAFDQKRKLEKKLLRKIARNAAFIAPVSDALARDMMDCGIEGNYITIPNVLKPAEYIKQDWNTTFHFGVIADLEDRQKNISDVIRAFKTLPPRSAYLTIVGDGSDAVQLKALAVGSENPIEFAGRWDNAKVLENIHQFDCLLVNSRVETFSVVTLEALSAGVPVIATRSGGPEEFITPNVGKTIEIDDFDALKSAMIEMHNRPTNFNFAEIAKSIRDRYNRDTVGEQYAELYRRSMQR